MEVIFGTVPSKSNSYKIIKLGNHCSMCKTPAVKKYEESFYMQLSGSLRGKMIEGFFELHIDVYYPSLRSDLDGCLKVTLDCLQKAKVFKNDNKCSKIIARKFIDKQNPRIEFDILEVN